ncbi:MAG TPA: hypothetical protein VFB19_16300 [Mycobacterium sp.]|nr:hypothetical protein [Mycobacterium sp.]
MKLVTVLALAGGLAAAPLIAAGAAAALPVATCDGAGCVPGVPHNASLGAPCIGGTRYVFGLDASGNTYICDALNQWVQSKPLIGVRTMSAPCDNDKGMMQSPDGLPMSCKNGGWMEDFDTIFYSKAI